jgi:hypothetical protein
MLAGDLNARVGAQPIYKYMGYDGEQSANNNERDLIDFCLFHKLKITNSFFRHKDIHKFTMVARSTKSIIYSIFISEILRTAIRDARVFRGGGIGTGNYLLQSTFKINTILRRQI